MKPERALVAERPVARHCAELLRRGPEPSDLLPELARLGQRLARALTPALTPLCGSEGDAPDVAVLPPRETGEAELAEVLGPLAANALFASGVPGVNLLVAVEGKAVLRLVDRAFGGSGEAPERLPARFPLSAELMIHHIEELLGGALSTALGQPGAPALPVLRRDSRFAELAPRPAGARLAALSIEVKEAGHAPWSLTLALPLALLPKLLGEGRAATTLARPADPAAAPFADMPLPLTARIVDMALPLATASALEVGAILPVAVARAVPLRIGGQIVAHGTVGAQDDRIAIKLTRIA
ncbi:MAG: FliM/FliN family flagellar motor switch protein [Sphingomonadales bacterium]|nr:FliM/FliN family flagellar motor switch protein [Sphingomonadales bacterium]